MSRARLGDLGEICGALGQDRGGPAEASGVHQSARPQQPALCGRGLRPVRLRRRDQHPSAKSRPAEPVDRHFPLRRDARGARRHPPTAPARGKSPDRSRRRGAQQNGGAVARADRAVFRGFRLSREEGHRRGGRPHARDGGRKDQGCRERRVVPAGRISRIAVSGRPCRRGIANRHRAFARPLRETR